MTKADFLLIDIGNTAVKMRLASSERLLGRVRRLPKVALLQKGWREALARTIADWQFGHAVLSSVVPDAGRVLARALPGVLHLDASRDTGVDLRGYPGRKTLGADRLANLAGALALYGPGALLVVDFGTAATFNALDAQGRFRGGVIAPGLSMFREYLPTHGAQLPPVRLTGAAPAAIGRSTVAAIRAGTLIGYRGMVREILGGLREEMGEDVRVIATGGDAAFLAARGWKLFDVVDPDLTFHGLRMIAARIVG